MIELTDHVRKYWQYEYDVSALHIIPWLEAQGVTMKDTSVIDVGCAYGGGLCAMYDRGARTVGFDLNEEYVETAKLLLEQRNISLATGNLYKTDLPFQDQTYDLVVLHDVFEHLEQKEKVIETLKKQMAPDGKLLITFPPYYSAYGAHQQQLRAQFSRIPFFHLIPFSISFVLPRIKGEQPHIVEEIQKLARLKMGMRKFEHVARAGGLTVVSKQAYLIGPNHIRFGLKPLAAGPIAHIPLLDEIACTGVTYLLSKNGH